MAIGKDERIIVGGDFRPLEREYNSRVRPLMNTRLNVRADHHQLRPLGKMMGSIRKEASEFDKSLEAANARVIAFAGSATFLLALRKAFQGLVSTAIEVNQTLIDLNSIIGLTGQQVKQLQNEVFQLARSTENSFGVAADAFREFGRQGLEFSEIVNRSEAALILVRSAGVSSKKAVDGLTAAINAFASEALTAIDIVDRFTAVEQNFAISSVDFIDAVRNAGAVAQSAGVQFNELIGLITAARQVTQRSGSEIGNAFRTIFTRLGRAQTLEEIEKLGVGIRDASGELRPAIRIFEELAGVFPNLNQETQNYVAELVGGVFNVNIFRAAISDLSNDLSIYADAQKIANDAAEAGVRRNQDLDRSLQASFSRISTNFAEMAAVIGGDAFEGRSGFLSELMELAESVSGAMADIARDGSVEKSGEEAGFEWGRAFASGIGAILSGPVTAALVALVGNITIRGLLFLKDSLRQFVFLNTEVGNFQKRQAAIGQVLADQGTSYARILETTRTRAEQEARILELIKRQGQAIAMQQGQMAGTVSRSIGHKAVRVGNFANDDNRPANIGRAVQAERNSLRSRGFSEPDINRGIFVDYDPRVGVGIGNIFDEPSGTIAEGIDRERTGRMPNFAAGLINLGDLFDQAGVSGKEVSYGRVGDVQRRRRDIRELSVSAPDRALTEIKSLRADINTSLNKVSDQAAEHLLNVSDEIVDAQLQIERQSAMRPMPSVAEVQGRAQQAGQQFSQARRRINDPVDTSDLISRDDKLMRIKQVRGARAQEVEQARAELEQANWNLKQRLGVEKQAAEQAAKSQQMEQMYRQIEEDRARQQGGRFVSEDFSAPQQGLQNQLRDPRLQTSTPTKKAQRGQQRATRKAQLEQQRAMERAAQKQRAAINKQAMARLRAASLTDTTSDLSATEAGPLFDGPQKTNLGQDLSRLTSRDGIDFEATQRQLAKGSSLQQEEMQRLAQQEFKRPFEALAPVHQKAVRDATENYFNNFNDELESANHKAFQATKDFRIEKVGGGFSEREFQKLSAQEKLTTRDFMGRGQQEQQRIVNTYVRQKRESFLETLDEADRQLVGKDTLRGIDKASQQEATQLMQMGQRPRTLDQKFVDNLRFDTDKQESQQFFDQLVGQEAAFTKEQMQKARSRLRNQILREQKMTHAQITTPEARMELSRAVDTRFSGLQREQATRIQQKRQGEEFRRMQQRDRNFQRVALTGAMGLSMVGGMMSQSQNENIQGLGTVAQGMGTGAMIGGMLGGPGGAAVGAVAIGAYQGLAHVARAGEREIQRLTQGLENMQKTAQAAAKQGREYIQSISNFEQTLGSGNADEIEKAQKAMREAFESITDADLAGELLRAGLNTEKLSEALKNYNQEAIRGAAINIGRKEVLRKEGFLSSGGSPESILDASDARTEELVDSLNALRNRVSGEATFGGGSLGQLARRAVNVSAWIADPKIEGERVDVARFLELYFDDLVKSLDKNAQNFVSAISQEVSSNIDAIEDFDIDQFGDILATLQENFTGRQLDGETGAGYARRVREQAQEIIERLQDLELIDEMMADSLSKSAGEGVAFNVALFTQALLDRLEASLEARGAIEESGENLRQTIETFTQIRNITNDIRSNFLTARDIELERVRILQNSLNDMRRMTLDTGSTQRNILSDAISQLATTRFSDSRLGQRMTTYEEADRNIEQERLRRQEELQNRALELVRLEDSQAQEEFEFETRSLKALDDLARSITDGDNGDDFPMAEFTKLITGRALPEAKELLTSFARNEEESREINKGIQEIVGDGAIMRSRQEAELQAQREQINLMREHHGKEMSLVELTNKRLAELSRLQIDQQQLEERSAVRARGIGGQDPIDMFRRFLEQGAGSEAGKLADEQRTRAAGMVQAQRRQQRLEERANIPNQAILPGNMDQLIGQANRELATFYQEQIQFFENMGATAPAFMTQLVEEQRAAMLKNFAINTTLMPMLDELFRSRDFSMQERDDLRGAVAEGDFGRVEDIARERGDDKVLLSIAEQLRAIADIQVQGFEKELINNTNAIRDLSVKSYKELQGIHKELAGETAADMSLDELGTAIRNLVPSDEQRTLPEGSFTSEDAQVLFTKFEENRDALQELTEVLVEEKEAYKEGIEATKEAAKAFGKLDESLDLLEKQFGSLVNSLESSEYKRLIEEQENVMADLKTTLTDLEFKLTEEIHAVVDVKGLADIQSGIESVLSDTLRELLEEIKRVENLATGRSRP